MEKECGGLPVILKFTIGGELRGTIKYFDITI